MPRSQLILVLALGCALSACGAPAPRPTTAAPSTATADTADLRGRLRVLRHEGNAAASALWTPALDGVGFNTLLERRLGEVGYLASDPQDASHVVSAELLRLDQPLQGMNYEITCKVMYRVRGSGETRELPILSKASATLLDHVVATRRLAIASERAVEANIRDFIAALGAP